MRGLATAATTLVKLALALSILALGWMVFSPAKTAGWPFSSLVEPWIAKLVAAFPVDRAGWGVLALALGAASLLAAFPKRVAARSSRRSSASGALSTNSDQSGRADGVDREHPAPPIAGTEAGMVLVEP
jgi:hypothetical protein